MVKAVFSLRPNFDLLVIDDSSPDGTAQLVKNLQLTNSTKLFLIERKSKQGLGTAYILGFKWALDRKYDYIFEMDCDFSHSPEDLPRLLNACENGADVAVGSRYCKGGKIKNWP